MPLLQSLCQYDVADLARRAEEAGDLTELAHLLHFLTVEDVAYSREAITAGTAFLKAVPECHRVRDSLARCGGIGHRHESTLAGLAVLGKAYREELGKVPDLPAAVATVVKAEGGVDDLIKATTEAGRALGDRSELSWAVVGRLARESRFTLIEARLAFMRIMWGVPTADYFAEVRDSVADHPLYPLLESYTVDPMSRREEYGNLIRKAPVQYLTARHYAALVGNAGLEPKEQNDRISLLRSHGDQLTTDATLLLSLLKPQPIVVYYAKRFLEVSSHSPVARACLIELDEKAGDAHAGLSRESSQHTRVDMALARWATAERIPLEAEKYYRRAIDRSKLPLAYTELAKLQLARGDEEKWLETLKESLAEPTDGLNAAQTRVTIARHYLRKKKYDTAREYADAAAETGAGWAMTCAAECAEADDDFDAAERWMRRTSERYPKSVQTWYFWCVRTGKGDLTASRSLVDEYFKELGEPTGAEDRLLTGVIHLIDDQPKKAAPHIEAVCAANKTDYFLLLAATTWDRAGDATNRDRVLKTIPPGGKYSALLTLLRNTLRKGEKETPTKEQIEKVFEKIEPDSHANAGYFVGQFLITRGKPDTAKPFLEMALRPNLPLSVSPVLAAKLLRGK